MAERAPRFEFRTEASSKFWEPKLAGSTLTVSFGKIGTAGQTHTKKFSSAEKAEAEYRKLVCEKLSKGYKPTLETTLAPLRDAPSAQNPMAITAFCLGQYISQDVAEDFCRWLTACLRFGMTRAQLVRTLQKFVEGDEQICDGFGMAWEEDLCRYDSNLTDVPDFYDGVVRGSSERFVPYYYPSQEATFVVALVGDVSSEAIQVCVAESERRAATNELH